MQRQLRRKTMAKAMAGKHRSINWDPERREFVKKGPGVIREKVIKIWGADGVRKEREKIAGGWIFPSNITYYGKNGKKRIQHDID